jgi:hypothetical protein
MGGSGWRVKTCCSDAGPLNGHAPALGRRRAGACSGDEERTAMPKLPGGFSTVKSFVQIMHKIADSFAKIAVIHGIYAT